MLRDTVTNMRMLAGFLFVIALALAADPITAGKYAGKWEGASGASGDFLIALAQNGGTWKAEVSFKMGSEDVKCAVTSLNIEGAKIQVVYTFDLLGMKLESTIDGERSGAKVSGKYRTRSLADNAAVDQGTWEASAAS
jgi:hypothetical protein